MSKDISVSSESREAMFLAMIDAIRDSQAAADMMEEGFDELRGINRTDGRCLDILQRHGPMTAGDLARHAGLTTGAVTPLLDRLELAGYVNRRRDKVDRRKVFVENTELTSKMGYLVYSGLAAFGRASSTQMSLADMEVVTRFLRTSALLDRKMRAVMSETLPKSSASKKQRLAAAEAFAENIKRELESSREEITQMWFGKK